MTPLDPGLLPGEAVTVLRPSVTRDDLGEPTFGEPTREPVSPVLVQPGSTADLGAERPNGDSVAYTLHFPKSYHASLRGCQVEVRGEALDVVGDPRPLSDELTPGPYDRVVEVRRADG